MTKVDQKVLKLVKLQHGFMAWPQILVCGGGDAAYTASSSCHWWAVEDGSWQPGPSMLYPRQRAATLQR